MINERCAKSVCGEDISLIENYDKAVKDTTQVWHCHHRKETDENLPRQELIELGLYWKRPASELIFLTHSEHIKLHQKGKIVTDKTREKQSISQKKRFKNKENNPMYGYQWSEEQRKHKSKVMKGKFNGENNPMFGKNAEDFMTPEAIQEKRMKQSESMKAYWARRKAENISKNK